MIKATDIQIGDWVLYKSPVKIFGIEPREGSIPPSTFTVNANDKNTAFLHLRQIDITPIPLTTEIMEKNGYGKLTNGSYALRDIEKRIDITIWRSGGEPTSTMEITKNEYTEKEVTYLLPEPYSVHELQHALRLCGLNELADNFQV